MTTIEITPNQILESSGTEGSMEFLERMVDVLLASDLLDGEDKEKIIEIRDILCQKTK